MRIFGVLIIFVALLLTVLSLFFGLPLPSAVKGLLDSGSLICVMGGVLGGCLIAYGSEWNVAFKPRPNREEAEIAVGVYKLAVRISIGAGFIGVMFGVIAILQAMSAGIDNMDMGAFTHGLALALISTLYGLVFAFILFLPLQYYFQHQLDKDS
jgi:flagellar motor component MotA